MLQRTRPSRDFAIGARRPSGSAPPRDIIHLTTPISTPSLSDSRDRFADLATGIAIFVVALIIGCVGIADSGTLWGDGPQYANAGAMIRDAVRSGQLLHPFEFARANYAQYPAFSLPYHPPGYPALLGAFFLLTGVSYESARVFIALLLGVAGCAFYATLRRSLVGRIPAIACTLLLLTMPEVAKWSRDTMSEIPALAFILAATFCFSRWLDDSRGLDAVLAFGLATLAFFSKINVIGVLLAWPVWAVIRGQHRRLFSPSLIVPASLFVVIVAAWMKFFIPYARYETQIGLAPGEITALRPEAHLSQYVQGLPGMTGWSMLVASIVALGIALRDRDSRRASAMWIAWLAGYLAFLLLIPLHYEARYFTFALPAVPALIALLFRARTRGPVLLTAYTLTAAALIENVVRLREQPVGVVGYDRLAGRLATLTEPGNVLVTVPFQNDLMFRYRAASPESKRHFIRGDRSITIRLPAYAPVANRLRVLVSAPDSLVSLIRRGRVRYIVTLSPARAQASADESSGEMSIAAHGVASRPDDFAPVDSFPVHFGELGPEPDMWIYLWTYRHPLPDGPSEIPITVPTARVTFPPGE